MINFIHLDTGGTDNIQVSVAKEIPYHSPCDTPNNAYTFFANAPPDAAKCYREVTSDSPSYGRFLGLCRRLGGLKISEVKVYPRSKF